MELLPNCGGEMNARQRGAYKLYWFAMLAYGLLLPIAVKLTRFFHDWHWKPLFMLLPLSAVVLILRSMMLYFSAADEMQRRILAEACAYAFVIVAGFFEGSTIPVIPWYWRFAFMMFVWGIAATVTKQRYK